MFAVPETINTEIFAQLPDRLRVKTSPARPHASFLEGPSFDRAGNLYCVDVHNGRILRVDPSGEFSVVIEYDGEPNGLKIHKDGRIFVADHKNGLMLLDPVAGRVEPLLERGRRERFKGLNDLFFASNGDLYFTDQGQTGLSDASGRLFRLRANGRLELLLDCIPSPNGLVLSRDEAVLYLAVTRANAIWRVPLTLTEDGSVMRVGTFINLSGGTGPDGLALDEDGSLLIAHIGFGTVWAFDRIGAPRWRIASCAGLLTTNLAYGGSDRRTLYITESETGSILTARLPVPGRVMYSHMA
jgi:gluconolactonase